MSKKIHMCSRRTIMDGEVVTIAPAFASASWKNYLARGAFEVSASCNAVMVHHAELRDVETISQFNRAIQVAGEVFAVLRRSSHLGVVASKYPSEPTEIDSTTREVPNAN